MIEGIGKNKFAASLGHIHSSFGALGALWNVGVDDWVKAHFLASGLEAIDEVLVVGGGVIVKGDETGLWLVVVAAASGKGDSREDEGGDFEIVFRFLIFSLLVRLIARER